MKLKILFKSLFSRKYTNSTNEGEIFRSDSAPNTKVSDSSSNKESKNKSVNEIKKKIESKYKKIKSIQEIAVFQKEATNLIINHLIKTSYGDNHSLIREIRFLLYYTFAVLQDDFFIGEKFFKTRMTRIDDYLFSQYSLDEKLKHNIKKLKIVASSNRFNSHSRKNLLSYFVFIEETGFEIIMLLKDFYKMLEKSQEKRTILKWSIKNSLKITKDYKKENVVLDLDNEVFKTLQTQQTTDFLSPVNAQREIFEDLMVKEKEKRETKES